MTSATTDDWMRFLTPVAAAVRNPPTPSDFRARCAALVFACRVDPADLTDSRARDLCRKAEFWPSVAEIEAVFAEVWRDKARARAIAGDGPARIAHPAERTAADVEAVRAKAAAFYADVAASQSTTRAEAAKPIPLRPHDLLAAYEAAGTPAAQFRAAQLRKAIGE